MDANKYARVLIELKETLMIKKHVNVIKQVLHEDSFFSEMPRKSYGKRLSENILWFIKYKEPCTFYNSYGFDVVGLRNQKEYLPYREFRIQRNNENNAVRAGSAFLNRTCILRDKVLFAAYLGECLGRKYIIANEGLLQADGTVFDYASQKNCTLDELVKDRNCKLFIKKIDGECGEGCYVVENGDDCTELLSQAKGSKYIIQKSIIQHGELDKINPSCVNTIRIVTIMGKNDRQPHVFAHMLRVGINSVNDNRATGGVGIGITDDGHLMKNGMGHHFLVTKHPVTGFVFEGYQLPYWKEVKELVTNAHLLLPEITTIGWDVAITPDGPVLVEGNDNWEITGPQDTMGGLKEKWYALHNM